MTGRITWLASYPKSGNTWFRAFLANLASDAPRPLAELDEVTVAAERSLIEPYLPMPTTALTPRELLAARPAAYRALDADLEGDVMIKTHDAQVQTDAGPLFPAAATRAAVYLVRNPLDVCVSLAHHNGATLKDTAMLMCDPQATLTGHPGAAFQQVAQPLGSWSDHVVSWIDHEGFPVHVVRYEDMHQDPIKTFGDAARFLEKGATDEQVTAALRHSSFERLRFQEQQTGFHEKMPTAQSFFRAGKTGSWRESLPDGLVADLLKLHRNMMKRLGYVDGNGNPKH